YPLLEAFRTRFPKGVVNTIYVRGNKIVPQLMQSGKINVLTLIGSIRVADELKKLHPRVNRLRAILGLDAKNATIVTRDAYLDVCVSETVMGSLSFNWQRCKVLKIVYVHRSNAQEYMKKLNTEDSKMKYGMTWEICVALTPLPEVNKPA